MFNSGSNSLNGKYCSIVLCIIKHFLSYHLWSLSHSLNLLVLAQSNRSHHVRHQQYCSRQPQPLPLPLLHLRNLQTLSSRRPVIPQTRPLLLMLKCPQFRTRRRRRRPPPLPTWTFQTILGRSYHQTIFRSLRSTTSHLSSTRANCCRALLLRRGSSSTCSTRTLYTRRSRSTPLSDCRSCRWRRARSSRSRSICPPVARARCSHSLLRLLIHQLPLPATAPRQRTLQVLLQAPGSRSQVDPLFVSMRLRCLMQRLRCCVIIIL